MSYKYSKGSQVIGDLKAADDAERNTLIDFGEDQIDFQTSGSVRLQINNSGGTISGSLNVTNDVTASSISVNSFAVQDSLEIGSQIFYTQGNNGFSVNEDYDPSNSSTQTAYHYTSGEGRETVAFTLARTQQFTNGFGIYGTSGDNKFVTFGEQNNTSFEWRRGVGIQPLDLDGGTLLASIDNSGNMTANSFTGSLSGTASNAAMDTMGQNLVGGVYEIDQGLFQNPGANPIYFPSDDSFTERAGVSSVNYFMAPFNGELIKIQVRSSNTDFSSTSLTASLHVGVDGDNAYSATPAASVAVSGQATHYIHTFDFMGVPSASFAEGDIYGFSLEVSGGYAGTETIHFTTVVRYDP